MSNKTPFIAFDTFALRELINRLTDNELRLYILMCTYADGKTSKLWPGIPELSEKSGIAPATVHRTLDRMAAKGLMTFIRRDAIDIDTGRSIPNVYQICGPFLPADSIKSDSTLKHENRSTTISNNNQEKQSVKNNQEPPPPTRTPLRGPLMESAESTEGAFDPIPTELANSNDKDKSEEQGHHQTNQNAAQPTQKQGREQSSSPGSAAPSPRDLTAYQQPLADVEHERLAARIAAECDTTVPVARETVDKFGPGAVEAAVEAMKVQAVTGGIKKSKFGLVKWHLDNGAIAQPDIAKARRRAALNYITSGASLTDGETGEVCHYSHRAGNQLTMISESGQYFVVSADDAIRLYKANEFAAAGE